MRNNAAYLPESPIVYIILPKSIRNRASLPIFDSVPLRQNANKICFCRSLIPIFDFVLDTPPRQSTNKFVFALGLIVSLQRTNCSSTGHFLQRVPCLSFRRGTYFVRKNKEELNYGIFDGISSGRHHDRCRHVSHHRYFSSAGD